MAERLGTRLTTHVVALVVTAMYVIPMIYVVMVSLTPTGESGMPSRLATENYPESIEAAQFTQLMFNSALITIVTTVTQVLLSCMAGYALAKLPVRGANYILLVMIGLLVIPPEIIMVPLFVMITHVPLLAGNDLYGNGGQGMLDSYMALMLPHFVSVLSIFLMRQFYRDLPDEIGQAARVDGASEMRIFAQVYTPLTLPAVAVVAVLALQSAWNDFLWPLIVVRSNEMRTLQLGLTVFYQENNTQWNLLMATVVMMSIPIVLVFLFSQRLFTSGITAGAVK